MEVHEHTDQFIRIEQGVGVAIINNIKYDLYNDIGFIVPAGTSHMIINTSHTEKLKLYTIYAPPEHKPNEINVTNPDNYYKNKYMKYKHKYFLAKK
jgi:mannose-6-phosphate isomerase-like protein (cupin superfamily)